MTDKENVKNVDVQENNQTVEEQKNSTSNSNNTNNFKNKKNNNKYPKRRKFCKFCAKGIEIVDYKDVDTLRKYINFNNKIMPKKQSGCCTKHQRRVSNAIKRARIVALLPFIDQN